MPMIVEYSQAEVRDAAGILALQKLAYQSEARLYQDWSIPPLTQTLDDIRSDFAGKTFLKALLTDTVVGSVRASLDGGTCAVGRLIVHPKHQQQGIGTQLMQAIEAFFPSAERFELFTGSQSESNIRLYTRLGYRAFRTERLSSKITLVFMEKRP